MSDVFPSLLLIVRILIAWFVAVLMAGFIWNGIFERTMLSGAAEWLFNLASTLVMLSMLIGLISKHGILIVEFANEQQMLKGMSKRDAILEAAGIRMRPVLMTTAAMVFGVVPLVTAFGAGAESRFSMGLVISVGMSIGTLFTLFVLPSIYTFLAHDHSGQAEETENPEEATSSAEPA